MLFFFSSRRRHTRLQGDWSSDVCSSDLFRKCTGIESETETIEYKEATKDGKMIIRKVPGAMKWSDITLERRVDGSKALRSEERRVGKEGRSRRATAGWGTRVSDNRKTTR